MRLSYAVQNLRRLKNIPPIEIRPLTILLGRNSAGKSTYLRSLPLLRQSIETRSSAPVLWYGDYVDFGNFESAVSDKDISKTIEFSFRIEDYKAIGRYGEPYAPGFVRLRRSRRTFEVKHIEVDIGIGENKGATDRRYLRVALPETQSEIVIQFKPGTGIAGSLVVNGTELIDLFDGHELYFSPDNIFGEQIFFQLNKKRIKGEALRRAIVNPISIFIDVIAKELRKEIDGRTSDSRVVSEARRILRSETLSDENLERLSNAETKTFQLLYNKLLHNQTSKMRILLDQICRTYYLLILNEAVSENLNQYFSAVEYIGPARARSERFYRQQELEVSEISPDGKNLPMFLASLSLYEQEKFSNWVENIFGYGVKVHKEGGHVSINLVRAGQPINIVDTGYGVSQVLPVLAQLWWMGEGDRTFKSYRSRPNDFGVSTLAIEQPELHLHPAHQAMLADVFAEAISENENEGARSVGYLLVETHSESMINRLGELIESGAVKPENVQIVIFSDAGGDPDEINVQLAHFDNEGRLQDWPFGFFNYSK